VRRAGIRDARQNLSVLLEDIRKGREVVITDRGRPIARLVPVDDETRRPFPGLARFRRSMPRLAPPLSETVADERRDRC
jgi:prevent-host-death family protein